MTNSIRAIDCVVNPITPEIMAIRPAWSKAFWHGKIGRDSSIAAGLTHRQMLDLMDRAGIERSLLIATKTGQLGIPGSWHLPYSVVADAVQQYPDRFSALAGLDPTEGMAGVRALRHAIEEYGFVGGAGMVLLFLILIFRCIKIVVDSPKAFGALLALGLCLSMSFQAFVNMGVAVGILPVTGLTIPLVSMGGTSLVFNSIAFGVILSVSRTIQEEKAEKLNAA